MTFSGPAGELLAAVGAVAAGGAFIGTAVALIKVVVAHDERVAALEVIGLLAAGCSVGAVLTAALEGLLT